MRQILETEEKMSSRMWLIILSAIALELAMYLWIGSTTEQTNAILKAGMFIILIIAVVGMQIVSALESVALHVESLNRNTARLTTGK